MEFKGTKGKWVITEEDSNGIVKSTDAINIQQHESDFFDICAVWRDAGSDPEKACANALLISKAPELLEMLEETKEALRWYMDNCTPTEITRNNDEIFFNLGTNLIVNSEQLIEEATELK